MTELESALLEVVEFLERHDLPYMVIGGLANLQWGEARLTEDVDVTFLAEESRLPDLLAGMAGRFDPRAPEPLEFVRQTHVIPIRTRSGIPIDLIWGGLDYEREAVARAVSRQVQGRAVRFCTAEDLILHKIGSERPVDRTDAERLIRRQGHVLDRAYLDPRVRALAASLEMPDLVSFYEECLRRAGEAR